ncbi:MAG: hypothetical protein WC530_02605 [Candidatus Omnitrophota bacterium]|jgi:hypothetical protein
MPVPLKIVELVKRFEEHFDAYKSGAYNETQVRQGRVCESGLKL